MPSIYDKSTRELVEEFIKKFTPPSEEGLGLAKRKPLSEGGHFSRKEIVLWFEKNYPKIKKTTINAHLTVKSINAPSRIHHRLRPNGADDLFFQIDKKNFRLYIKEKDPEPIYPSNTDDGPEDNDSDIEEEKNNQVFAYENDLKNFLSKNLDVIEDGLKLYEDEDITGIEFPVGGRFIDILAVDENDSLAVIELKVSKGYDRVIGQLLRYMAWIEKNLALPRQAVRGMIIANHISEDLKLATSRINDVSLYEYELSLKLRKVVVS